MSLKNATAFSLLLTGVLLSFVGCSVDSPKSHYLLAEKLWTDKNYSAAVSEFERVVSEDPQGKLGRQALYRAATTQILFLSQYGEGIRKFRNYIQGDPDDPLSWQAQVHIGEILFSKLDQYDQAIGHYRALLKQNPGAKEAPGFLFRIGKSQFYLLRFDDAVSTFKQIENKYPFSPWAEKAAFEIGVCYLTQGEKSSGRSQDSRDMKDVYEVALEAYERFIRQYPKSSLVVFARFGIASSLEELNRLEEAFQAFSRLKPTYPAANVIDIKLNRIRERLSQKNIRREKT